MVAKFKRLLVIGSTGIAGLLLTLAGLNLIEISPNLILYTGLGLLVLAVISYFLPSEGV